MMLHTDVRARARGAFVCACQGGARGGGKARQVTSGPAHAMLLLLPLLQVVSLVERFYDPSAGRLLLDGHDLRSLNLRWLRSNVGPLTCCFAHVPWGQSPAQRGCQCRQQQQQRVHVRAPRPRLRASSPRLRACLMPHSYLAPTALAGGPRVPRAHAVRHHHL